MNTEEKLNGLMDGVYMICKALVTITENECCAYGFEEECDMAETYVKHYEADHLKGDSNGKET